MNDTMKSIKFINDKVREYFNKKGHLYISSFPYLTDDHKEHIINMGTSIICTRDGIGLPGGSFVQSVVNNNLSESFARADSINTQALKFYVVLLDNIDLS